MPALRHSFLIFFLLFITACGSSGGSDGDSNDDVNDVDDDIEAPILEGSTRVNVFDGPGIGCTVVAEDNTAAEIGTSEPGVYTLDFSFTDGTIVTATGCSHAQSGALLPTLYGAVYGEHAVVSPLSSLSVIAALSTIAPRLAESSYRIITTDILGDYQSRISTALGITNGYSPLIPQAAHYFDPALSDSDGSSTEAGMMRQALAISTLLRGVEIAAGANAEAAVQAIARAFADAGDLVDLGTTAGVRSLLEDAVLIDPSVSGELAIASDALAETVALIASTYGPVSTAFAATGSAADALNDADSDLLALGSFIGDLTQGIKDTLLDDYTAAGIAWDSVNRQVWVGDELEGLVPGCNRQSVRHISAITDFDINLDGRPDILLPISCYKETLSREEVNSGRKHNIGVKGAWKLFCSDEADYYDCTDEKFGEDSIDVTQGQPGGGNPYIHVMDTPKDLNADGYPEFFYAINRDDGRPGFSFSNPDDYALLEQFCGPFSGFEWDCTRKAIQSILISDPQGQYRVLQLPWAETNTQAVTVLPNVDGGYDVMAFNYGNFRAARLDTDSFIDVTAEYNGYTNIGFVGSTQPYNAAFFHDGKTYLATPEIPLSLAQDPNATSFSPGDRVFTPELQKMVMGFALWEFTPGAGFELSDYYQPDPADRFSYKEGNAGQFTLQFGAYVNGYPIFQPRWHFFEYVQLSDDEDPLLVVHNEASGTRIGPYFGEPLDLDLFYQPGNGADLETTPIGLSPFQAFYIVDGELVERTQPIMEGGLGWSIPGFKFEDLDQDGDKDLVGIPGHTNKGSIYLNDDGTLYRLLTEDALPGFRFSKNYSLEFGFGIRNLGNAPNLDIVYWAIGTGLYPPDYTDNIDASDFGIMKATRPISEFPRHELADLLVILEDCQTNNLWFSEPIYCRF